MGDGIERGRAAFDREAWGRAYEHLAAAAEDEPLEVDDLERLASAAYLVGRSVESSEVWARAHQECARIGEVARAARCAFWLAFSLLNGGEVARGGGWVDRAQRLLDDRKLDCVEQGYLRYAAALRSIFTGDPVSAETGFREAAGMGERFLDPELTALARIGQGRCLIYMGEVERGVALLDEAMVAVGAGEVSAIATGDAYCTVIEGCHELFDVGRTREWTAALSRWCDAQPELVLYRGQCLVHRIEVLQLRGEWEEALVELERARSRLADPTASQVAGAGAYAEAELHRLRGETDEAEQGYRAASDLGRDPQPGLALLRVAQGRLDAADAAIRRALQEAEDPMTRARLLGPFIEIVVDTGDAAAADEAARELSGLADALGQPYLRAVAAHMTGVVLLAQGDASGALGALRAAWLGWRDLEAPYEAARARLRIALACEALGDADGAEMELDAARAAFVSLGATPDAVRAEALAPAGPPSNVAGLTTRELEVLALVATGMTNRQVADTLVVSEKTVASHVSHIFTKVGVSSRAAATAYAYEQKLV
jgi:DNA-binding NarL/FixJ family response regulator